jgi:DNA-binding CsgD family transcriptional regulator
MSPQTISAACRSPKPASDSAVPVEPERLTPRELEVASWIGRGKRNDEIAKIFERSTPTVEKHVENLIRKLGVENRTGVCTWWHEHGKQLATSAAAESN